MSWQQTDHQIARGVPDLGWELSCREGRCAAAPVFTVAWVERRRKHGARHDELKHRGSYRCEGCGRTFARLHGLAVPETARQEALL